MSDSSHATSHYDVLGLRSDASPDEIRAAWRRLVRQYHPDHGALASGDLLQRVNRAYEVLSHPHERAQYDIDLRLLRGGGGRRRHHWLAGRKAWLLGGLAGVAFGGLAGALLHHTGGPSSQEIAASRPADAPDAPLTLVPARRLESWGSAPIGTAAPRP